MFSNKFDVGIVHVFKFELLALISYFYSLGVIIVFKFLIPFFVVYIFLRIFSTFFQFF